MTNKTKSLWGGGIKSLKPSKSAFTLAEVLITLAIIGIVAALTIPTLVSKNEKKQLYTQLMKSYNTFSNAFNMSVAENGDPKGWINSIDSNAENAIELAVNKFIAPYIKIAKVCDFSNVSDCLDVESYKFFSGDSLFSSGDDLEGVFVATLTDGSIAAIMFGVGYGTGYPEIYLYIDINGKKGPNIVGRDLHVFYFGADNGYTQAKEFTFSPMVQYTTTDYNGEEYDSYGKSHSTCDPLANGDEDMNGMGCADRMIKEGAMNY